MAYGTVLVERRGGAGLITRNRPKALNALSSGLAAELGRALDELEGEDSVAAIVLTGSDKAFAAGADIKETAELDFVAAYRADSPPPGTGSPAAASR